MKLETEKALILSQLDKERTAWIGARAAAVAHTTSETVEAVSLSVYRLNVLLDELIEVNLELA